MWVNNHLIIFRNFRQGFCNISLADVGIMIEGEIRKTYLPPIISFVDIVVENGMGATAGSWEDNNPFGSARGSYFTGKTLNSDEEDVEL